MVLVRVGPAVLPGGAVCTGIGLEAARDWCYANRLISDGLFGMQFNIFSLWATARNGALPRPGHVPSEAAALAAGIFTRWAPGGQWGG